MVTGVASVRLAMGQSMNNNLAVYRNQAGMEETLRDLTELVERYSKVPVDNKGRVFNTDLVFAAGVGIHAGLRPARYGQRLGPQR